MLCRRILRLKFYLSLYGHRLPVMTLDVSDDSQMIASGSADKNVRLWSTQFGNCLRSLKAHNESVMQAGSGGVNPPGKLENHGEVVKWMDELIYM